MATYTRPKQINYKRAVFTQPIGKTLQQILQTAISKKSRWGDRQDNPSGDNQTFCFVNHGKPYSHREHSTSLYGGELFSYVKGSDQSIFNADPNANEVEVDALPPGRGREFLEGALYFSSPATQKRIASSSANEEPGIRGELQRQMY